MVIAIIPARGGSKRIPRKNVRDFLGQPVMQLTIENAIGSETFSQIYVSTDDEEIASLAKQSEAKVLTRSGFLSDDFATTYEVISNHVRELQIDEHEIVVCIYPVTPLLDYRHVHEACRILRNSHEGYVFAAQEVTPINRSFHFDESGNLRMLFKEKESVRTQDLPKVFCDSGLFYAAHAKTWIHSSSIFSENSSVIEIGKYESIDIDVESDWRFAEELYLIRKKRD